MLSLLGLVGQFFSFIPGLTSLGQTWVTAAYNAKVQQVVAQIGCDQATAVAIIQMQGQVQTKWWFVAIIPPLFALPYVLYVWRAVVFDNVIMDGATSTPALGGTLATVFIMVVTFYFAHGMSKG